MQRWGAGLGWKWAAIQDEKEAALEVICQALQRLAQKLELKPPPLNVGTGAAFDIFTLRQKEKIEEGECAGKKKADVIWKKPVCGNHPKI